MGKKLGQINQEIGSLGENMKTYLHTTLAFPNQGHVFGGSQLVRFPGLINEAELIGLNDDSRKLMEWVLQEDGPLTVIGIVGMGGIGKTTLAQKISTNVNIKKHFTHSLIVVVSQNFELKEIVKDMLTKLGIKEDSFMRDDHGLLEQLHDLLKGKYLIILDDIWTTNEGHPSWWERLKSAFPQRNEGSCVIITTRNVEVARSMGAVENRIHHHGLLSEKDSWSLFSKLAFAREGGQCPSSELRQIGKKIVSQCGGLPLAIKVVGGMMLGKSFSEWKHASDHLKKELSGQKKEELIFSALRLSYEELPMHLKPCMLCFAVFLEDYEISMDYMIKWWISESFVRGRDEKSAYEIGEEWWIELLNRGLLLAVEKDPFERVVRSCRVHDMMHAMIREIAKDENFVSWDDKGIQSWDIRSRRLGIIKIATDGFFIQPISKLLWLRVLILENIKESKFNSKLYQLKWLRILDVEFTENYGKDDLFMKDDWWRWIGSLSHLTFLSIKNSRLERLPKSLGNLQSLQSISLGNCHHLKMLPPQVTSLEKLTFLYVFKCKSLEYYPVGIRNLSNLQVFWGFVPACSRVKEGCCVSDLQKLTQLRKLYMEIDSEDQIGEEELHVLSQLKQLKILLINFKQRNDSDEQQEQFLRKINYEISPFHQLQELYLMNFPGEMTPAWLCPTTLPSLQFLLIGGGNMRCMHSGFFGKSKEDNRVAWKLETLVLKDTNELEVEWPRMQRTMPYLRLLKVNKCPKLKLFPCDVEGEGRYELFLTSNVMVSKEN